MKAELSYERNQYLLVELVDNPTCRWVSYERTHGAFTSEQNRVQGGMDFTAQSAMSYLGSGLTGGRPLEGSDMFVQGLALRPKEEPGDVPPLGTSLPIYPSRSSSFVAQSLALGP